MQASRTLPNPRRTTHTLPSGDRILEEVYCRPDGEIDYVVLQAVVQDRRRGRRAAIPKMLISLLLAAACTMTVVSAGLVA